MTYKRRRHHPCDFRMPFVIATLNRKGVTALMSINTEPKDQLVAPVEA